MLLYDKQNIHQVVFRLLDEKSNLVGSSFSRVASYSSSRTTFRRIATASAARRRHRPRSEGCYNPTQPSETPPPPHPQQQQQPLVQQYLTLGESEILVAAAGGGQANPAVFSRCSPTTKDVP